MTAAKKVQPRCSTSTSHVQLAYAVKEHERNASKGITAFLADKGKNGFGSDTPTMTGHGVDVEWNGEWRGAAE
ncbi:MAG TPA: hypothetical protein VGK73_31430 [Polyangiaceae bacterium]